jgi:hypothetical protein
MYNGCHKSLSCFKTYTSVSAAVGYNPVTLILLSWTRTSLHLSRENIWLTNITESGIAIAGFFAMVLSFFSYVKDTHINEYKCNHNGHHPRDFSYLQEPNAWMCNKCYNNKIWSSQVQNRHEYYICISIS